MLERSCDVAVVGGGLGGLAVAALLARRGFAVVVSERAHQLGGRAASHAHKGFHYNEGPHALYRGGAAARVLSQLDVRWTGRRPPGRGVAVLAGRSHALPATAASLLATGLVRWSAKVQGARLLAGIGSVDAHLLRGVPLEAWLESQVPDRTMRAAVLAFVRVTTYVDAPSMLDAGAAIEQLRLAQRAGVAYVDEGWQTLVDGLSKAAAAAGAVVQAGARVLCAAPHSQGWKVSLEGGRSLACRAIVLATGPTAARSIVSSDALAGWANRALPVRAACLDVALARLPAPKTTFALGIDRPLYLSVHSHFARLAPEGAALVSTMKYLAPGEDSDADADLASLEAWLDGLQPGWRELVLERRWLPAMIASNALVTAAGGGFAGRPGPRIPDARAAFVVGDWVGAEGMLLDASLASAARTSAELGDALTGAKVA